MPTLRFCLQQISHRDLRAMVTRLNLRSSMPDQREHWIRAIEEHWYSEEERQISLDQLSESAKAALLHLAHGYELPAALFWAEYGEIRRIGGDYPSHQTPWLHPETVSEELYYAGLIHTGRHSGKRKNIHKAQTIIVPDDLRALVIELRHSTVEFSPTVMQLLHDLAQLLIYCHEQDRVRLLHGRWLPPAMLRQIGLRLWNPVDLSSIPSHKQHSWLRFLIFLTQAGYFLGDGRLTPRGWDWLEQRSERQWALLWEAWKKAPAALRQEYDLAGGYLPAPWQTLLARTLRRHSGDLVPAHFAARLLSQSDFQPYFVANFDDIYALEEVIYTTFSEDFQFLGLLEAQVDDGVTANTPFLQPYAMTAAGAWILHPILHAPPFQSSAEAASLHQVSTSPDGKDEWHIHLPAMTSFYLQTQLATYADYTTMSRQEGSGHTYRLHRLSVARAAARGHGLPALLDTLRAIGCAATSEMYTILNLWHDEGRRFHLQYALLLRSRSTQEMSLLYNTPNMVDLFGEALSPTAVILSASAQDVVAQLADQDIFIEIGTDHPQAVWMSEQETVQGGSPADGARWLAGRLYALLAEFLLLPFPAATLALDDIWQRLPAEEQAILAAQSEKAEAALRSLLDGFVTTPAPTPTDPVQWLPSLEAAIASESTLALTYFTAGRNLLTCRLIQPYWIEERRGNLYVRAYCHSAERVLVFRLDRIQGMEAAGSRQ
jgi:hypothetical protein